MKIITQLAVAVTLIAAGCHSLPHSPEELAEKRSRYDSSIGSLHLGRIDVRNETHEKVFTLAQQLAKQNDPSGIGVEIVIPARYQERYERELMNKPISLNLGPHLTMRQFMAEFPFDDWFQCYWTDHRVLLLPADSIRIEK